MSDEASRTGEGGRGLAVVLARLADPASRVRAAAADEAGDYFRGRIVDQVTVEAAVARLVAVAAVDGEEDVREAALHACDEAVGYYDLPLGLFEPLVPLMSGLSVELIGYVLGILGATHDPAARPVIASFASHPDSSVREEAAEALVELAGRPS